MLKTDLDFTPLSDARPSAGQLDLFAGIAGLRIETIARGGVEVERIAFCDARALGDLFTTFRRTARKVETALSHPLSRPMSVEEVADALGLFSPGHRHVFEGYRRHFAHARGPVRLDVPAYDLGRGRYLLLDGAHRVTALYMADVPCEIGVFVLRAPVDRRMFPDLKYWDGGLRRLLPSARRSVR